MQGRALFLAALMCLVPAATAQGGAGAAQDRSTERITFYGHVFGNGLGDEANFGPQPANTQAPIDEANYGVGLYHWCTPAGTATLGTLEPGETCRTDQENTLALFSTPGIVDVETPTEFAQEGAYAQLHNERGQTKDILLGDGEITAQLFMTVDRHGWPVGNEHGTSCIYPHPENVPCAYPYWGWDVGAQPDFTVQATLYQADLGERSNASAAPPINEALESGEAEVIAQGSSTRDLAVNGLPGTPKALEFNISLGEPQVDRIDRVKDFFIVHRFYSETSGQAWGTASWRIWSGEFFPPTFTLPVRNPITVERVVPTFAHGQLAILGVANTPWGSYDVQRGSVDLTVDGPDGDTVEPEAIRASGLSRSLAHGGHYIPVNKTWVWDYKADDLAPGNYTVTVDAENLQASASASCSASFTIEDAASGVPVPGEVHPGRCGFQTVGNETVSELAGEAGGS